MTEDRVIRDPSADLVTALIIIPVGVGVMLLDDWLFHDAGMHPRTIVLIAVGGALASMLQRPTWVRVGPRGVAFGSWWRRPAQFRWQEIETFEVGNPLEPQIAYVVLRGTRGQERSMVKLPSLRTVPPVDLVEVLRGEQHRHAAPDHGSGDARR